MAKAAKLTDFKISYCVLFLIMYGSIEGWRHLLVTDLVIHFINLSLEPGTCGETNIGIHNGCPRGLPHEMDGYRRMGGLTCLTTHRSGRTRAPCAGGGGATGRTRGGIASSQQRRLIPKASQMS